MADPTPLRTLKAGIPRVRLPAAPPSLGPAGRRLWAGVQANYQLDEAHQRILLESACAARDRIAAAQALIVEKGLLSSTTAGTDKANPAVAIERNATLVMVRCLRELGLDVVTDTGARPPSRWT